jgi:hypothetical protein
MQNEISLAMASINALFNVEVFQKRNFDALDEIYTSGARILPPGSPMISGRTAIKEFWSGAIESLSATAALLESVEVIPSGDGIVEIGRATITMEPEGQPSAQAELKYVVYWRQEDGKWKWDVDIWNMNS